MPLAARKFAKKFAELFMPVLGDGATGAADACVLDTTVNPAGGT